MYSRLRNVSLSFTPLLLLLLLNTIKSKSHKLFSPDRLARDVVHSVQH